MDVSEDVTTTKMVTSKEISLALANINDIFLDLLKDRGILASYLLSPLTKNTMPENKSQLKLIKDPNSIRVNNLLIT